MNLSIKPALALLRPVAGGLPKLPAGLFKSLLPLVLLATAITALVLMFAWRDQASYKPVFGGREKVAVTDMITILDAQGIAYRLHPDSGQLLVAESRLGEVRMLMAAKGVVAKLPQGLELMDRNDPLGVSQFVQDVRFRRGLEGELTQSVMTLDPVESARVHLSIAKSTSFVVNDGEKSSASVVLALKRGRSLSTEQIAAIINLVANSVANLDAKRVSVVDQAGNFLSSRVDLSTGYEGSQINDAAKHFNDETRRNIDELLSPMLGRDNFKTSVTAEVDNDRVQETQERYGEAPKVTNEAMRTENGRDPLALGIPGSLSNRPVTVRTPDQPAEAATEQKNATTRQYAYDRSVTQVQRGRGRLKKLSVAVVLNNDGVPGGKGWTPEALANVDKVLRGGLGIDAARGDSLVVSAMDFPGRELPSPWYEQRENVIEMGSWASYALAALLAFLLVVRPLLKLARQRLEPPSLQAYAELQEPGGVMMTAAQLGLPPAAKTPALGVADAEQQASVVSLLENYDLPPPGSPVDVLVDHLKVLSAKEPERVAEVVRQWVQKNGRA